MAANADMFLWWGSGSVPCWKPMLVLAELGLWEGCPNKLIEFSKKEHKAEDVMKLNPRGQMPTFRDGDVVVNESSAISLYLESKYSNDDNKLIPDSPAEKAAVYQKMFEVDNIQTNIMNGCIYYKLRTKKENWDMDLLKESFEKAEAELSRWNNALDGKSNLCGENFSMADVFLFPYVAFLVRNGASLNKYPHLEKYHALIKARPSVQATWPPHWKDTPSPTTLEGLGA